MKNNIRRGKTWDEIYGKEKANNIRKKVKKIQSNLRKGKTYEELYGKEKAKKIQNKQSLVRYGKINTKKGKTFEEFYGEERAAKIKIKHSKSIKGKPTKLHKTMKGKKLEDIYGEKKATRIKKNMKGKNIKWRRNDIIKALKKVGDISKYNGWVKYRKKGILPSREIALKHCNNLEELASEAGIKLFKIQQYNMPNIGKNETQILNDIEKQKHIKLERQFPVAGKFIDGYDPINNMAYEVDESHHKNQQVEDFLREEKIKNVLGCEFARIPDF